MNELLEEDHPNPHSDRELTLSTGTILSLFVGLVLLCGLCFGVGYNVGHKSAPAPLPLSDLGNGDGLGGGAGSANSAAPAPDSTAAVVAPAPATTAAKPSPVVRRATPVTPTAAQDDAETTGTPEPRAPAPAAPAPAPVVRVSPSALMPSVAPPPGAGNIMVQVAAVSHQEDADLLVGALRSRGYTVSARPSSADNFIHVQVGPFADKKQAETMRQRLIADGYNAILK